MFERNVVFLLPVNEGKQAKEFSKVELCSE